MYMWHVFSVGNPQESESFARYMTNRNLRNDKQLHEYFVLQVFCPGMTSLKLQMIEADLETMLLPLRCKNARRELRKTM